MISPHSTWQQTLHIPLGAAIFLLFLVLSMRDKWRLVSSLSFTSTVPNDEAKDIGDSIRDLFAPIIHDFTAPLVLEDGKTYEIQGDPIWTEPLREKLCIVDLDSRPMDKKDEPWNSDGKFDWHNGGTFSGILNHYMYAKIHGYCYKFIHLTPYPDRDASWARIPALSALLTSHQLLVSIDADVIFPNLHVPYEWLLNHWNVTPATGVTLALEPYIAGWDATVDANGRRNLNNGFMTLQNTPRTHDMLRAWADCPNTQPACYVLRKGWPADQGAFNDYVRYEFPDLVRELPCDDALGYPHMGTDCHGRLVSHYTMDKAAVREASQKALAWGVMKRLQGEMGNLTAELKIERPVPD